MKSILLFFMLAFATVCYGQTNTAKTIEAVTNGVETIHDDAKEVVSTVYADGKSVVQTAYEDTKYILKEYAPKAEAALMALATTVKTTAEDVFRILTIKQIASSISYLFLGVISFIGFWLAYKIVKLPSDILLDDVNYAGVKEWKSQYIALLILSLAVGIGFLIGFSLMFQDMVIGFVAPKYGALQEVLEIVKTFK